MMHIFALYMIFSTGIMCYTFERHTELGVSGSDSTLKRSLRDPDVKGIEFKIEEDDSLVGTFPVTPIDTLDEGVTRSIGLLSKKKSAYEDAFKDPAWKKQWYMHDYRTKLGPVMDLNVVPVYRMGISGEGIYVAVVDKGVDSNHPDLQRSLAKDLAYTACNDMIGTAEPMTPLFASEKANHGTRVAGVIGMTPNNTYCGVGIAYDAKIVAINHAVTTDLVNGKALSHAREKVDVYSNSWGPKDTGKYMEKIGKMTADAFEDGIKYGRNGLGAIFTFSGGNGGDQDDNCSVDDYVNHIYTIAIAAVTQIGKRASFSESCTAIYASTSSGGYGTEGVFTTTNEGEGDYFDDCTSKYLGTSASAPQASAIIALVLQANKKLTYRDVMHVITMGSEVAPLADNDSWYKNGAGFWVSNEFGFGQMNALNMVNWALKWKNVPEKTVCEFNMKIDENITIKFGKPAKVKGTTDGCQNSPKLEERVFYLEQIILTTTIEHRYRGALSIMLKSPTGTESEILTPRKRDTTRQGLRHHNIKSVHNWGENPSGEWNMEVHVKFLREGLQKVFENIFQTFFKSCTFQMPDYKETGTVQELTLTFHGTRDAPDHHARGLVPRTYSAFRTANGKRS